MTRRLTTNCGYAAPFSPADRDPPVMLAACLRGRPPPLLPTPPFRPAFWASSLVHSCAVPRWCAAIPPFRPASRASEGFAAKPPRLSCGLDPLCASAMRSAPSDPASGPRFLSAMMIVLLVAHILIDSDCFRLYRAASHHPHRGPDRIQTLLPYQAARPGSGWPPPGRTRRRPLHTASCLSTPSTVEYTINTQWFKRLRSSGVRDGPRWDISIAEERICGQSDIIEPPGWPSFYLHPHTHTPIRGFGSRLLG